MKPLYLTPGPSQVYKEVSAFVQEAFEEGIPEISHRSKKFQAIYEKVDTELRKLLNIPHTHTVFFTASSLESMERVLQNCVDEVSFHFVDGSFSKKAFEMAKELGKKPMAVTMPDGEGFAAKQYEIPKEAELLFITDNETSTGVAFPLDELPILAKIYPDKLIAVDTVSSAPYTPLDFSSVDIAFFSVQKGFGMPAGLGVLIVSDRAVEKARKLQAKGTVIGTYHSFVSLSEQAQVFQTPETPNVLGIYVLGKVAALLNTKGITTIRKETEKKANMLYEYFENSEYKPFVTNQSVRSQTTIVIDVKGKAKEIIEKLKKHGFVVASGYGKYKDDHIRIANFPQHTIEDIQHFLHVFQTI